MVKTAIRASAPPRISIRNTGGFLLPACGSGVGMRHQNLSKREARAAGVIVAYIRLGDSCLRKRAFSAEHGVSLAARVLTTQSRHAACR